MVSEKIESIMKRDVNDAAKLSEAVTEIEVALAALAENAATPDQLGDLADAVDAFKERAYGVAVSLARAASSTRRKVELGRRPDSMLRSLAEICDTFAVCSGSRLCENSSRERKSATKESKRAPPVLGCSNFRACFESMLRRKKFSHSLGQKRPCMQWAVIRRYRVSESSAVNGYRL